MSSKKVIAVFGATGTTGGSVAKYLLEDGQFAVRAITRNASSEKAKALAAAGAEVVTADLGKPETLPAALSGAYGVVGLTDFWAVFQTNNLDPVATQAEEERQGRSLVDAAKAAKVNHFVWFSLWDGNVPHFVGKYHIGEYLKASGLSFTILFNAFYFENLSGFGMIKTEGGKNIVSIPLPADKYIPSYSAHQSGGWVLAAFKNPGTWIGRDMKAIGEHLTPRQYVSILNEVTGKKFELKEISDAEFAAGATSTNPYEKELYLNMKAFVDTCQPPNSIYGSEEDSKKIYPGQYDFRAFCQNNEGFKAFVAKLA